MNSQNELELSIQLEENQQKSKEQELEEFIELTRKIADSDRNNDLLRSIKKQKLNQLQNIKNAYREIHQQKEIHEAQAELLSYSLKEAKNSNKGKKQYLEELTKKYEEMSGKEKLMDDRQSVLGKQNEKLEKKIQSMQGQYQLIVKNNKEKQVYAQKLKKQREMQEEIMQKNEQKIDQFESMCENSKNRAEELENAIKKEMQLIDELQSMIIQKQKQLDNQRKERQETSRKQQQIKRSNLKLASKVRSIEEQIDKKKADLNRLQAAHIKLQKQVQKIYQSQQTYEDIMQRRRELVANLKKCNGKAKREKETQLQLKLQS